MNNLKKYVLFGLLISLEIVLTRFVQIPITLPMGFVDKVSLGFFPVFIAGAVFGIKGGACVAALGDILRAILFPQGGAINLLFTCNATLRGVTYGTFLYKKTTVWRILLASFIILILNIFLLGYFISITYAQPYEVVLYERLTSSVPNFVIQCVLLCMVGKPLERRLGAIVRKQ